MLKVKKNSMVILLFLIFSIRPYYVMINDTFNNIWAYITIVLALGSLYLVTKKGRIVKTERYLLGFLLIMLFSTLINNSSQITSAISTASQIMLPYNIGVLLLDPKYKKRIEYLASKILTLYLYTDSLTTLLGLNRLFGIQTELTFLGYDNFAAFSVLSLLTIKFSLDTKANNDCTPRKDWICWLMCLISKVYSKSIAAIIVLVMFALLYMISIHHKKISSLFKPFNIFIVVIALFVLLYYCKIYVLFAGLLQNMGKGSDLNSRIIIWQKVIGKINQIPLLGFGITPENEFREFFGFPYGWNATHAHNIILCLIVDVGIIGCLYFIFWVTRIAINRSCYRLKWYRLLLFGIGCYLFQGLWDFYPMQFGLYYMLSFALNYKYIIPLEQED